MLLDSITNLATGTYTVTRRLAGTIVDGNYIPNPTTTSFSIVASVQPARGLPRITGGRDMLSDEQNQHTVEALALWTRTEMHERTPTQDPDEISVNGRTYTCARSERWDHGGQVHYMCVITLQTEGAS